MGKLRDEIKYRTGACSFQWAEEYEEKKRAQRPYHQYQVQIRHNMINIDTVVSAQAPIDAVNAVLNKGLNINKKEWSVQVASYKDYNPYYTNVKVTKLGGIKRISYYGLTIMPVAVRKEQERIEQERVDWARREQYQGIY